MIDNQPFRPTVRVIEVCHDPDQRQFAFPGVRNINRLRIGNGYELRRELKLNAGRYDRPAPDDDQERIDLGLRVIDGLPVYRFQFDFEPSPVVLTKAPDEPIIGPHSLSHITGISRHQIYLAMDVGAVDTIVSHWRGRPLSYIVCNERLNFWMWAYAVEPIKAKDISIPDGFAVGHVPDLFDPNHLPASVVIQRAVRSGELPGSIKEEVCTVARGYQWVRWIAERRSARSSELIIGGMA